MIPPRQSERPALRPFAFRRPPAEAPRPGVRAPGTEGGAGIDGLPTGGAGGVNGRGPTPMNGNGNEGGVGAGQMGQPAGQAGGAQDSITLGQLKAHTAAQEKQKVSACFI